MKIYAMYRGESLLHIGTLEEIAELHGVKPNTIYYYSMPVYQRRRANSKHGNYISVIKIEEDYIGD